jgi:hypothetical protein
LKVQGEEGGALPPRRPEATEKELKAKVAVEMDYEAWLNMFGSN